MADGGGEEKKAAKSGPKGDVYVNVPRCKGCSFCVEFCPTHVLELSHDYNPKGYHYPVVARAEACNGCDLCGMYCPDFAIFGVRRKATCKPTASAS
jgi:2-oxoglutarate ferredoxin oxidoreductase subunit delta